MSEEPKKITDEKIKEFRERFGTQKITKRRDKATTEKRRQKVWTMAQEGISQTTMADILHVSRQTVNSDMDYMTKVNQGYAKALKLEPGYAETDIGNTAKQLLGIYENAMADAAQAVDEEGNVDFQARDRSFNTAQKALVHRHRVLMESGFLPKAGVEIKSTVEHKVSFEQKFGKYKIMDNDAARRRIMTVADAIFKLGVNKDVDATATVKETTPVPPSDQTQK